MLTVRGMNATWVKACMPATKKHGRKGSTEGRNRARGQAQRSKASAQVDSPALCTGRRSWWHMTHESGWRKYGLRASRSMGGIR